MDSKLLLAAKCALADLQGIAQEKDIDLETSTHPIAKTIAKLIATIAEPTVLDIGTQKYCENKCPQCNSDYINWDISDFDNDSKSQTATCLDCGIDFCEVSIVVYQYTEVTGG